MVDMKTILEAVSKRTAKTVDTLKTELDGFFNELDESIPKDIRESMAKNRFVAYYRKKLSSNASEFRGVFLGASSAFNLVGKKRREAIEIAQKDPTLAKSRNIVDEEGNPLYNSNQKVFEKMLDWQIKQRFVEHPNGHLIDANGKTYRGKSMPKEDFMRQAIVAVETEKGWRATTLRIRGNNTKIKLPEIAEDTTIRTFRGVQLKNSTDDMLYINDASNLELTVTKNKLNEKQIIDILTKVFEKQNIQLEEIEEFCKTNPQFGRFAVLKVVVTEINPNPTKNGSLMIRVQDESIGWEDEKGDIAPPVMCFFPDKTNMPFGERAEIYIIGNPNVSERGKNLGILGFYVPEYYANITKKGSDKKPIKEESDELDETEDFGF